MCFKIFHIWIWLLPLGANETRKTISSDWWLKKIDHDSFYIKQVSQTWISNCIQQHSVRLNYLSLSEIHASGTKVLMPHVYEGTGIILCMGSAYERQRNNVTSSLIGWAHAQNNPSRNTVHPMVHKSFCFFVVAWYQTNQFYPYLSGLSKSPLAKHPWNNSAKHPLD